MLWGTAFAKTVALFALTRTSPPTTTQLFSSTSLVSKPIEATKYDALLDWLKSLDAEINDKIELRQSEGCGFGAFVTGDVEEGELLFTVPRKACLTLEDATGDANCGEAFANLIKKAGPGGNTVVMAGYMAKEYLIMQEALKKGGDGIDGSRWAPYFETLPWTRGTNDQEHVLFWSEDMVESLLKGSMCYGEATALREEIALATRIMTSITSKSIRAPRGEVEEDEGFSWPWQAKTPPPEGPPEGLKEAIQGAFVCLLTRAFQDGDGDKEKLVALLDMLQHSATPNVRHVMRKEDGTVEVRSRHTIPANTELLNQYRSEEEESMPYSRFFTRFGFVPGILEPMENLLKDKSSIFYPQKAEV